MCVCFIDHCFDVFIWQNTFNYRETPVQPVLNSKSIFFISQMSKLSKVQLTISAIFSKLHLLSQLFNFL